MKMELFHESLVYHIINLFTLLSVYLVEVSFWLAVAL